MKKYGERKAAAKKKMGERRASAKKRIAAHRDRRKQVRAERLKARAKRSGGFGRDRRNKE